jgi:hypothetical protein
MGRRRRKPLPQEPIDQLWKDIAFDDCININKKIQKRLVEAFNIVSETHPEELI